MYLNVLIIINKNFFVLNLFITLFYFYIFNTIVLLNFEINYFQGCQKTGTFKTTFTTKKYNLDFIQNLSKIYFVSFGFFIIKHIISSITASFRHF